MRKLILSLNITLDGYMAGPRGELDWHFRHWNNEMSEFAYDQLREVDTILMGRVTYETMAAYWPKAAAENQSAISGEAEFAKTMNHLPKFVISKTLSSPAWTNSFVIKDDVPARISSLKKQPGKDLITWGGVMTITSLMKWNLIDEYRIAIAPVVIGEGLSFTKNLAGKSFRLHRSRQFNNGVVLNYYHPK